MSHKRLHQSIEHNTYLYLHATKLVIDSDDFFKRQQCKITLSLIKFCRSKKHNVPFWILCFFLLQNLLGDITTLLILLELNFQPKVLIESRFKDNNWLKPLKSGALKISQTEDIFTEITLIKTLLHIISHFNLLLLIATSVIHYVVVQWRH